MSTCDCLHVKCIGCACVCACQGQGGGLPLQTSDAWDPINSCIQQLIWLQMEVEIKGADESKGFQAGGGRGHVEVLKAQHTPNWELRTQLHLWSNHVFDAIKWRVLSAICAAEKPCWTAPWLIWFIDSYDSLAVLLMMEQKNIFFIIGFTCALQHPKSWAF